ncbi:hypothetical protein ACHAWF_006523 [Thalassiosira exigua]
MGVLTRRIIKQISNFNGVAHSYKLDPFGKGLQYNAIKGFKKWRQKLQLPRSIASEASGFVNETWYPHCKGNSQRMGKKCFFGDLNEEEEIDHADFEARESSYQLPAFVETAIRSSLLDYYKQTTMGSHFTPPLGHLMVFAHIARMFFHRAPPVLEAYRRHRQSIWNRKSSGRKSSNDNTLMVSLHIRRADSCGVLNSEYQQKASLLDSVPQVNGVRMCYETSVYLEALNRIKGIIEDIADDSKQALIGETAVADLWHLSHGECFVGHMGSRFGKVSYALATARRNRFIPFATVDGHSFCCEIDENCAAIKPHISSMINCVAFAWQLSHVQINRDYWGGSGSMARKIEALLYNSTNPDHLTRVYDDDDYGLRGGNGGDGGDDDGGDDDGGDDDGNE